VVAPDPAKYLSVTSRHDYGQEKTITVSNR
jgi:hypothetical protein